MCLFLPYRSSASATSNIPISNLRHCFTRLGKSLIYFVVRELIVAIKSDRCAGKTLADDVEAVVLFNLLFPAVGLPGRGV